MPPLLLTPATRHRFQSCAARIKQLFFLEFTFLMEPPLGCTSTRPGERLGVLIAAVASSALL